MFLNPHRKCQEKKQETKSRQMLEQRNELNTNKIELKNDYRQQILLSKTRIK